ncbi:MAG: hypothetical protein JW952_03430 [Candidatus Eisenbacteria bacterium]|nr:hypothetical protein [Candidatus Eisenbacteria bacterium]
MYWLIDFLRNVDWNSPQMLALTALLLILGIMRKWFLLAMSLLVITLGRGLCSLQMSCAEIPDNGIRLATLVYLIGGTIVVSIAAVEFFVKE